MRRDSEFDVHVEQTFDPPYWQNLTFAGGFGLFALTRLLNWLWRPAPVVAGDTPMYIPTSEQGRFGLVDFLGNRSRPGVITFLFAVFESPERIVLAQHLISCGFWALLLITIAKSAPLPRPSRAITTLLVAGVASTSTVTLWNDFLLSESFSLSWLAALSCAGLVVWSRYSRLTRVEALVVGAWVALFTALLGPVRPLSLGMTAIILLCLMAAFLRSVLQARRGPVVGRRRSLLSLSIAAGGLSLVVASGIYVVKVDSRANYAWGREFAGLENFNGRAIQQLTVINASSKWAHHAFWHYVKSVGDECLESGFSTGQYWPATAMQCPDGIRILADTFHRHYLSDYLRSLPEHLDESLRDFRLGWAYIAHIQGYGVDFVPSWAREVLMNPNPDGAWSPLVYPTLLAILWAGICLLTVLDRVRRHSAPGPPKGLRPSVVLLPSALFAVSMAAVAVTIIVSPGDPRVAVVHAVSARIWLLLSLSALSTYFAARLKGTGLIARFSPFGNAMTGMIAGRPQDGERHDVGDGNPPGFSRRRKGSDLVRREGQPQRAT